MGGLREPGMDNDYYEWSPLVGRTPLRWPHGARVALCVVVCLEHYEIQPPEDAYAAPNLLGTLGRNPYPDFRTFSMREYGNRVGVFRVMQALDRAGIRATAAIDAATAERCPFVVEQCRTRGWEFAGHGQTVNRMISSRMSEDEERAYLRTSIDAVERFTGERPRGWLGPEFGESARTPALLAEAGLTYVLDWPNDDQPYQMHTPNGALISVPVSIEHDDTFAHWYRRMTMARWRRSVEEAFATLHEEGALDGRLFVLNLHPWLIGQPYRVSYLEEVLATLGGYADVWKATAGEVAEWCR